MESELTEMAEVGWNTIEQLVIYQRKMKYIQILINSKVKVDHIKTIKKKINVKVKNAFLNPFRGK